MIDAPRGRGKQGIREREKKLCALCNEFGRMSEKLFCICEAYILYIYHQFDIHYDIWRDFFLDSKLKEFAGMESEIELISVYLMYN